MNMKSSRGNAAEESTAQLGYVMASSKKLSDAPRTGTRVAARKVKKDHRLRYLSRNIKPYNLCKMVFFIIFGMRMPCALHFCSASGSFSTLFFRRRSLIYDP